MAPLACIQISAPWVQGGRPNPLLLRMILHAKSKVRHVGVAGGIFRPRRLDLLPSSAEYVSQSLHRHFFSFSRISAVPFSVKVNDVTFGKRANSKFLSIRNWSIRNLAVTA